MADLVADCPRCDAQSITFDVGNLNPYRCDYGWQIWYEAFCTCRKCNRSSIFVLADRDAESNDTIKRFGLESLPGALNVYVEVRGHITSADMAVSPPPEHLPDNIDAVFREGAKCLATRCHNAAGTMFRLCIDLATRSMLPEGDEGPPAKIRRNLGLRLPWLFENELLPKALEDLSSCVREDGNDGAHAGTLGKEDAEDLRDFTYLLLERLYTEPRRLGLAAERRQARRKPPEVG